MKQYTGISAFDGGIGGGGPPSSPTSLPSFPISCPLARPPACLLSTFPLSRVAARIIIIIISIYRPSPFYSSSSLVIEAAREGERKAIESTRDAPRHASTSLCARHSPGNEPSIEMNGRATQPDKKRCQEFMPGQGSRSEVGLLDEHLFNTLQWANQSQITSLAPRHVDAWK